MKHGSWIKIARGTEGPRHDPYAYTELTMHRADGREATVHLGLAEWMTFRDFTDCERTFHEVGPILNRKFEAVMGLNLQQAMKAFAERKWREWKVLIRQHRHCTGEARDVEGYPGESFTVCGCGEILESHFDRSAIE